jgi:predicted aldo/keto reductase-like oxidoreductase
MIKFDDKSEIGNLNLSRLGLGIEHFAKGSRKLDTNQRDENSRLILKESYSRDIKHYDLVFNLPFFFDVFREFISDKRKDITFTTHLGNVHELKTGKNQRTRSLKLIKNTFDSMLDNLDTDYVDIALLQNIINQQDYDDVLRKGNLEYAKDLKKEGRTRVIGVSGHNPDLLLRIIQNGDFDVVMFTLNFATSTLESTRKLIGFCKSKHIKLIAIKVFMRGKVFSARKQNYPSYICCGKKFTTKLDQPATPADCINHALSLGANSVVFGVKNVEELKSNIESFEKERKFENLVNIVSKFEKAMNY